MESRKTVMSQLGTPTTRPVALKSRVSISVKLSDYVSYFIHSGCSSFCVWFEITNGVVLFLVILVLEILSLLLCCIQDECGLDFQQK